MFVCRKKERIQKETCGSQNTSERKNKDKRKRQKITNFELD